VVIKNAVVKLGNLTLGAFTLNLLQRSTPMSPLRLCAAVALCAGLSPMARGALALNSLAPYATNFDFLATSESGHAWVNDAATQSTQGSPGWYWQNQSGSLTYDAGMPGTSANGAYSIGNGVDRAMGNYGGPGGGSIPPNPYSAFGIVFRNDTTVTINSVTVSYWAEHWTRSPQVDSLRFSYRASAANINDLAPASGATPGGWLAESALNFQATNVGTLFFLDPVVREQRTATLTVSVAPGEHLALRWYDADDFVGVRDATMAIDDLTVSFSGTPISVPEASAFLGCGLVLALLGAARWFSTRAERRSL
jgi:hypothetical protein